MSLLSRKHGTDNWSKVDDMLERIQLGIQLFEQKSGRRPAAIMLDYDMFWRILHSEHIILKPRHIVEFDGIRLFPVWDLGEELYLAERLFEVPHLFFLREG